MDTIVTQTPPSGDGAAESGEIDIGFSALNAHPELLQEGVILIKREEPTVGTIRFKGHGNGMKIVLDKAFVEKVTALLVGKLQQEWLALMDKARLLDDEADKKAEADKKLKVPEYKKIA